MRDWKAWIAAALVRALKTVAQTAIAMFGTSVMLSEVSWPLLLSTAGFAGLLSLLTSVAGLPEVKSTAVKEP